MNTKEISTQPELFNNDYRLLPNVDQLQALVNADCVFMYTHMVSTHAPTHTLQDKIMDRICIKMNIK